MIQIKLKEAIARAERLQGRRLTYLTIGNETGIAMSTLSHYATGQTTRFDAAVLERLCAFLDCGVGDILEYVKGDEHDRRPKA